MAGKTHIGWILLVVVLFFGAATPWASASSLSLDGMWYLQGTVGTYPITAVLEVDGLQIWGTYCYEGIGADITLVGIIERSGAVVMFELDPEDYLTATLNGVLTEAGFGGQWVQSNAQQTLPVEWQTSSRDIWSGVWNRAFLGADEQWKWSIHESATVEFWDWSEDSAWMEIWAASGSHMGYADGRVVINGRTAVWRDPEFGAAFTFERRAGELLLTAENAQAYAGAGVAFDGVYRQRFGPNLYPNLWDLGVFPTQELDQAFRELVGEHYYDKYLSTFHLLQFRPDKDGLDAVVVDGFVRGLAGEMFGRIMYTKDGYFAAAISEGDGWLTYISNHPRFEFEIPASFEDLRDRLAFG